METVKLRFSTLFPVCQNCDGEGVLTRPNDPCCECGGKYEPVNDETDRGFSPGTGYDLTLVKRLFGEGGQPITSVVLTDKRPHGGTTWYLSGRSEPRHPNVFEENELPGFLFDDLSGFVYPRLPGTSDRWKAYRATDLAIDALSNQIVDYCRDLVGLPAIYAETLNANSENVCAASA